jgi:hypothetical protein
LSLAATCPGSIILFSEIIEFYKLDQTQQLTSDGGVSEQKKENTIENRTREISSLTSFRIGFVSKCNFSKD